jgi:hypothetical protein
MGNNVLNWFINTFHDDYDNNGSHIVSSNGSCFMKDLEQELLEVRKKDIMNVLKILNDNYPINDGGPSWLGTDEDCENVANQIIEFEKQYTNDVENNDNKPCECYLGPKSNGRNCSIFAVHCDGMSCKKDCDFYNKTSCSGKIAVHINI